MITDITTLAYMVATMRRLQKEYLRTHNQLALRACIAAEKDIDQAIADIINNRH